MRSPIRCFDAMYISASYQVHSRILRELSHTAQYRTDPFTFDIACIHSEHELFWISVSSRKSILNVKNGTVFALRIYRPPSWMRERTSLAPV